MRDQWELPESWNMGARQLSPGARRVLFIAHQEARRLNHEYVGTEHILMGLSQATEEVAARVLSNLGVELDRLPAAMEAAFEFAKELGKRPEIIRQGEKAIVQFANEFANEFAKEPIVRQGERSTQGAIGLTNRAKRVIEIATEEARRMNQTKVNTEHLLIGLLREGKSIAAGFLLDPVSPGAKGLVTLDAVVSETYRVLGIAPSPHRRNIWQRFSKL